MNDRPPPRLLPLIAFTAIYMLAAVAGAVVQGNKEFVFYIVVMLVLIGVVTLVHRAVTLTSALLWALSLWGLLHMAGGLGRDCDPVLRRCVDVPNRVMNPACLCKNCLSRKHSC